MRIVFTPEGLAIAAGSFVFIPNHITKAVVSASAGALFLAYSAKEFGYHHSEKLILDREDRDPQLKEGDG